MRKENLKRFLDKGGLIMPYVLQERRPALDKIVDRLVEADLKRGEIELFLLNLPRSSPGFMLDIERHVGKALKEARRAVVKPNGDINYILFKYCKYNIKPSYNNYKTFIGEIYNALDARLTGEYKNEYRESAAEIRRRILGPYEDKKIKENGDV